MNSIRDFSPGLSVVVCNHEGGIFPVAACPIDKCSLVDYESDSVSSPVSVMLDLCRAGLVAIDAAVSCHGSHNHAVSQGKPPADVDGLEEAGHDCKMFVEDCDQYEFVKSCHELFKKGCSRCYQVHIYTRPAAIHCSGCDLIRNTITSPSHLHGSLVWMILSSSLYTLASHSVAIPVLWVLHSTEPIAVCHFRQPQPIYQPMAYVNTRVPPPHRQCRPSFAFHFTPEYIHSSVI